VRADLTLAPLRRPDGFPEFPQVMFDRDGERALIEDRSKTPLVWDLAHDRVVKQLGQQLNRGGRGANSGEASGTVSAQGVRLGHNVFIGHFGFTAAALSPDGRWLAAVDSARGAPVVVWDLTRAGSDDPASSLRAVCNLEESGCITRLCAKITNAVGEPQLRELVGADAFSELAALIKQARCGG
jgi:hypothetical protein